MLHARTAQNAGPLGSRLSVKGSTFDRSPSRTDLAVCQSRLDDGSVPTVLWYVDYIQRTAQQRHGGPENTGYVGMHCTVPSRMYLGTRPH